MKSPPPYFVVGPARTVLNDDLAAAGAEFAATRALVCHGALDPALTARLGRICDQAEFRSDHVDGLGHRRIEKPATAGGAISLLLRRADLFRWLEAVTGRGAIADIEGRVVQTYPVPGDELVWHNDIEGRRRLAITIALDSPPYQGGEFELRRVGETDNLLRFTHAAPGTALIFIVSPRYEHRLLPLVAGGPRRVFTGWFMA